MAKKVFLFSSFLIETLQGGSGSTLNEVKCSKVQTGATDSTRKLGMDLYVKGILKGILGKGPQQG